MNITDFKIQLQTHVKEWLAEREKHSDVSEFCEESRRDDVQKRYDERYESMIPAYVGAIWQEDLLPTKQLAVELALEGADHEKWCQRNATGKKGDFEGLLSRHLEMQSA